MPSRRIASSADLSPIQDIAVNPFSSFNSDNVNKLTRIISNGKDGVVHGLDVKNPNLTPEFIRREEVIKSGRLYVEDQWCFDGVTPDTQTIRYARNGQAWTDINIIGFKIQDITSISNRKIHYYPNVNSLHLSKILGTNVPVAVNLELTIQSGSPKEVILGINGSNTSILYPKLTTSGKITLTVYHNLVSDKTEDSHPIDIALNFICDPEDPVCVVERGNTTYNGQSDIIITDFNVTLDVLRSETQSSNYVYGDLENYPDVYIHPSREIVITPGVAVKDDIMLDERGTNKNANVPVLRLNVSDPKSWIKYDPFKKEDFVGQQVGRFYNNTSRMVSVVGALNTQTEQLEFSVNGTKFGVLDDMQTSVLDVTIPFSVNDAVVPNIRNNLITFRTQALNISDNTLKDLYGDVGYIVNTATNKVVSKIHLDYDTDTYTYQDASIEVPYSALGTDVSDPEKLKVMFKIVAAFGPVKVSYKPIDYNPDMVKWANVVVYYSYFKHPDPNTSYIGFIRDESLNDEKYREDYVVLARVRFISPTEVDIISYANRQTIAIRENKAKNVGYGEDIDPETRSLWVDPNGNPNVPRTISDAVSYLCRWMPEYINKIYVKFASDLAEQFDQDVDSATYITNREKALLFDKDSSGNTKLKISDITEDPEMLVGATNLVFLENPGNYDNPKVMQLNTDPEKDYLYYIEPKEGAIDKTWVIKKNPLGNGGHTEPNYFLGYLDNDDFVECYTSDNRIIPLTFWDETLKKFVNIFDVNETCKEYEKTLQSNVFRYLVYLGSRGDGNEYTETVPSNEESDYALTFFQNTNPKTNGHDLTLKKAKVSYGNKTNVDLTATTLKEWMGTKQDTIKAEDGQVFYHRPGTEDGVLMQTIMNNRVYVCQTPQDLESTKHYKPSAKDIGDTWVAFGHAGNKQYGIDPDYPMSNSGVLNWSYSQAVDGIKQALNTSDFTGFVTRNTYKNYTMECSVSSNATDDDCMGLVVAFAIEPNGRQHTLSICRTSGGMLNSPDTDATSKCWHLVLDYNNHTSWKHAWDMTSRLTVRKGGWKTYPAGAWIRCVRTGNNFEFTTSELDTTETDITAIPLKESTKFSVNLDELIAELTESGETESVEVLKLFKKPCTIGICTISQQNATFNNITVTPHEGLIIDLYNNKTWRYENGDWVDNESLPVNHLEPGRQSFNECTGKLYWIDENKNVQLLTHTASSNSDININTTTVDRGERGTMLVAVGNTVQGTTFTMDGLTRTLTVDYLKEILQTLGSHEIGELKLIARSTLNPIDENSDEFNGWIYPDGRAISRTRFPAAFAEFGESFGAGDGETTFNIPTLEDFLKFNPGSTEEGATDIKNANNPVAAHTHSGSVDLSRNFTATGTLYGVDNCSKATAQDLCPGVHNAAIKAEYGSYDSTTGVVTPSTAGQLHITTAKIPVNISASTSSASVTVNASETPTDPEPRPKHNLVPVLMWIGKPQVTRTYTVRITPNKASDLGYNGTVSMQIES